MQSVDAVYANLRPENILIKFDRFKSRIDSIKFIDFGSTTSIGSRDKIILPVRLDHIPPETLTQMAQVKYFNSESSNGNILDEVSNNSD